MATKFWTEIGNNLKNEKIKNNELQKLLKKIEKEFVEYFEQLFPNSMAIIVYEEAEKNGRLTPEDIEKPLIQSIKIAYPKKAKGNRDQRIIDAVTNFCDFARECQKNNDSDAIQNKIVSGVGVINSINALHNQIERIKESETKSKLKNSIYGPEDVDGVKMAISGLVTEFSGHLKNSGIFEQKKLVKNKFEKFIDLIKKFIGLSLEKEPIEVISSKAHIPNEDYDPAKARSRISFD